MEAQITLNRPIRTRNPVELRHPVQGDLPKAPFADELNANILGLVIARYAELETEIGWYRVRFQLKSFMRLIADAGTDAGKRLIDLIGAALLLILLSPLVLLITILIKLESDGPALFRQIRVGKWGRPFTMYKFRSMCADAEHRKNELLSQNEMAGGVIFKMKRDPRITRIGMIIRRTSLDELPQLWNVLKGDMSLVGPRPPVPAEVESYSLEERRRLDMKPGITCVWQVSGRSELTFRQQVDLDVAYIESQSTWGDLWLLLKTIPAVLLGRGAY
ncbi:MAG: exopolysaccharide biosynthesis polyprenyl glycosylphosphotransferase [Candidatus Binataceae bacterium]|jgi:exopolysaccharide biosynthesis polyprenyl glycosylphosphotransferase